jgi:uncharacterized SAM-binding protein YcdF (DUF218 family)
MILEMVESPGDGKTTGTDMRKKGLYFVICAAIISATLITLSRESLLMAISNFLIIQDKLETADVIHVIAGDDYRTDYAIQLYKQGFGRWIFFTGGWCIYHKLDHGEHGQELALQQGVPSTAIAIDSSSVKSTYDEAIRLKDWIDSNHPSIQTIIVVSDPFHMRRARWTYRRIFGKEIKIMMAPVPFDQTPYKRQWWSDEASRRYVRDEYIKIVYYLVRYQIGDGKIKDWLATFDKE